jgi:hypothetical protein
MKILSITRLIIVGFVLFAGGTNAIGQSRDWKTFEATVFQVADAVVRGVAMGDVTEGEMASLRNDAAQLEMRFATPNSVRHQKRAKRSNTFF